ncbi:MAG: ArnT family glycosyltransferase [Candidatus Binatia bacterium]
MVQDIVNHGNWLFPLRMGSDIPSKPPLFHWLGALISIVRGEATEAAVRFPSALLATLGILSLYFLARRLFNPEIGLWGAVILATSVDYQRLAISARVDMTLALFVTLSLVLFFSLYRGYLAGTLWYYVFFLVLGVGILAKGPVSVILSGMIIVIFLGLRKRWDFLFRLCCHKGVVLAVIVGMLWYGVALVEGGEEFFNRQIVQENVARFFFSGEEGTGHQKPVYYYLPYLLSGGLPWSLFFPFVVVDWFKGKRFSDERSLFFAVWALVVFVFFSLSVGKRSPYLLPVYPPLSLLVAGWFQRSIGIGKGGQIALRLLGVGSLVLAMILLVSIARVVWDSEPAWFLSVFAPALEPRDQANLLIVKEGLVRAGGLFIFFLFFSSVLWISLSCNLWTLHIRALPSRLALISLLSGLLVQNIVIPSIAEARSYGPFMRAVNRVVERDRIYLYSGALDVGSLFFYRGSKIPAVEWSPQEMLENLQRTGDYFIMRKKDWERIEAMNRDVPAPLLESKGSGPDGDARLVLVHGKAKGAD